MSLYTANSDMDYRDEVEHAPRRSPEPKPHYHGFFDCRCGNPVEFDGGTVSGARSVSVYCHACEKVSVVDVVNGQGVSRVVAQGVAA